MRIGIDARKLRDFGIGTYIQELLHGLRAIGSVHQYTVFVPDERARSETALGEDPRFTLTVAHSPSYSLRELVALPLLIRRHRLDLLHATHYVLPPMRPCPAVVTVHDLIHLRFPAQLPSRAAWLYAQAMLRWATRSARRVITVSEATRRDLEAYLGVPRDKIRVIPNGVSPRFHPTEDENGTTRTLTGLGVHRPYLLFVGNPKPHKNLPFLLEVFARLAPTIPSLSLVVAGAGDAAFRGALWDRVARAGLRGRVTLLGHLPSDPLVALYQGAFALVFPSRYEGFGLPALEAMACGTPVVASAAGALPEVIGEAGWLLPPDDHEAWLAALRALWGEAALRDKLRARGLERARAYPWRRAAVATEAVYEEVGRWAPAV